VVEIVPAAPFRESTFTSVVSSPQRGIEADVAVPPPDAVTEEWDFCFGPVGTGPASLGPPPQPATSATITMAAASALVMGAILGALRNPAGPRR
jgi:hypothetical protein